MKWKIGDRFTSVGDETARWRVTDVGTRVVVAIDETGDHLAGPPYSVAEVVWDEDDQVVMIKLE